MSCLISFVWDQYSQAERSTEQAKITKWKTYVYSGIRTLAMPGSPNLRVQSPYQRSHNSIVKNEELKANSKLLWSTIYKQTCTLGSYQHGMHYPSFQSYDIRRGSIFFFFFFWGGGVRTSDLNRKKAPKKAKGERSVMNGVKKSFYATVLFVHLYFFFFSTQCQNFVECVEE